MTSYEQEGYVVDKKGWNLHMSARPDTITNVAGVDAFTLDNVGDIPAGAILIPGDDPTRVDIATGTAGETMLGIATHTRMQDDIRPLTYTILGYVNLIAGTGGVGVGDLLAADTVAAYYGTAVTHAAIDEACIGKALTAAGAGERFLATVNFMK